MIGKIRTGFLIAVLSARSAAFAATAEIDVTDARGHPLPDAVIELAPAGAAATSPASTLPAEGIIDQRHETFLPLVTVIRRGGHVIFTNNDTTMHQVYSFSDIKQFAFEIEEGEHSQPVVFDKPGVAAIGCNIHDQMITYVYVATAPWGAVSDRAGHALIADIPDGSFHGTVWHPALAPGAPPRSFELSVSGNAVRTSVALSVTVPPRKKSMHMQMY
jgi:plastocyanin